MLARLSVDDSCDDEETCESVWVDLEDGEDIVIIGRVVPQGAVPLGDGENAVRIRRKVVVDAKLG